MLKVSAQSVERWIELSIFTGRTKGGLWTTKSSLYATLHTKPICEKAVAVYHCFVTDGSYRKVLQKFHLATTSNLFILEKKQSPCCKLAQVVVWYTFYTLVFIHSSCQMETGKIKTFVQYFFLREPLRWLDLDSPPVSRAGAPLPVGWWIRTLRQLFGSRLVLHSYSDSGMRAMILPCDCRKIQ